MSFSFYLNHISSEGAQEDYIGREFSVFFPVGVIKANFSVPIVDDNVFEPDKNFSLTLEIPQPAQDTGVMRGDAHTATVVITNDEREYVNNYLPPSPF